MDVAVALPVPEFLHQFGRRVAQVQGDRQVPVLFDIRSRLLQPGIGRVVLWTASEVRRALREVQPALRQADQLDRLGNGRRYYQRHRGGVADILDARITMRRAMKRGASPAS